MPGLRAPATPDHGKPSAEQVTPADLRGGEEATERASRTPITDAEPTSPNSPAQGAPSSAAACVACPQGCRALSTSPHNPAVQHTAPKCSLPRGWRCEAGPLLSPHPAPGLLEPEPHGHSAGAQGGPPFGLKQESRDTLKPEGRTITGIKPTSKSPVGTQTSQVRAIVHFYVLVYVLFSFTQQNRIFAFQSRYEMTATSFRPGTRQQASPEGLALGLLCPGGSRRRAFGKDAPGQGP